MARSAPGGGAPRWTVFLVVAFWVASTPFLAVLLVSLTCVKDDARGDIARADLRALHEAARSLQLRHGRWPTLSQLWRAQDEDGFLLEFDPVDPWDEEYDLLPAEDSRAPGRTVSAGPDGKFDTTDDLVFPSRER